MPPPGPLPFAPSTFPSRLSFEERGRHPSVPTSTRSPFLSKATLHIRLRIWIVFTEVAFAAGHDKTVLLAVGNPPSVAVARVYSEVADLA